MLFFQKLEFLGSYIAKHGLNIKKGIRSKYLIFGLFLVRAYGLKREREKIRREEEKGRRKKEKNEKFRYGNYLCKETIVRMLVWNCLETLVLEVLV